ncbi:MAG: PIN domain-containing protein [candidate division Zixibacteria bacterium]|nr:PIN domain-containing protein [candidate division Zixibacteria bacterium]
MRILVDTPIWSLAFRRGQRQADEESLVDELRELIHESRAVMIGPIRQEILSGIPNAYQFEKVRKHLRAFDDLFIPAESYERAAELFNLCRAKGVQGSQIDFLICAVAQHHGVSIFTSDGDFKNYVNHIRIVLHTNIRAKQERL